MTTQEIIGLCTGIAGLFLTIVGFSVKATREISKAENEIRADMDAHIDNIQRDIARHETTSAERENTLRRETGEVGNALRTKIHEIETWSRDNFVRKESFELVVSRLEKSVEKMGDRLEEKLEKIVERFQRGPQN